MSQKLDEYTRLRFSNVYGKMLVRLRSNLGCLIVEYDGRGILISSSCFSALYKLATEAASELSEKRLQLDIEAISNLGLNIKEYEQWLKANQHTLLLEKFWREFVLNEYQKPIFRGKTTEIETQTFTELQNILHQAEHEITARTLLPSPAQTIEKSTYNNFYGSVQINKASGQAIINIGVQIEDVAKSFVDLLRVTDISSQLKDETIPLVDIAVEQNKNNKLEPTNIKSLLKKLKLVSNAINSSDTLIKSSGNMLNYIKQLGDFFHQFIS